MISLVKLYLKREFDPVAQTLLDGNISDQQREQILEAISFDTEFREHFCEWIKFLRESEGLKG